MQHLVVFIKGPFVTSVFDLLVHVLAQQVYFGLLLCQMLPLKNIMNHLINLIIADNDPLLVS